MMRILLREEREQCGIDLVGVGPEQSVRRTLDLDVVGLGEKLRKRTTGGINRENPVCRALQDEGGHVDLGNVATEVS
jgi:hypothetical protein